MGTNPGKMMSLLYRRVGTFLRTHPNQLFARHACSSITQKDLTPRANSTLHEDLRFHAPTARLGGILVVGEATSVIIERYGVPWRVGAGPHIPMPFVDVPVYSYRTDIVEIPSTMSVYTKDGLKMLLSSVLFLQVLDGFTFYSDVNPIDHIIRISSEMLRQELASHSLESYRENVFPICEKIGKMIDVSTSSGGIRCHSFMTNEVEEIGEQSVADGMWKMSFFFKLVNGGSSVATLAEYLIKIFT